MEVKLEAASMWFVRKMSKVSWTNRAWINIWGGWKTKKLLSTTWEGRLQFLAHSEEERNRRLLTILEMSKAREKDKEWHISAVYWLHIVEEVTIQLEFIQSTSNREKSIVAKIEIHGTWRGRRSLILLMYLVMESSTRATTRLAYMASSCFNIWWIVFVIFVVIVGFSGTLSILSASQVTWKRSSCSLERIMRRNGFSKIAVKSLTGCLHRYFTHLWSSFCLGWWTRLQ